MNAIRLILDADTLEAVDGARELTGDSRSEFFRRAGREAAARAVERDPGRLFAALARNAAQGGKGWRWAGGVFARRVAATGLMSMLTATEALAWFDERYPGLATLVPRRRRREFAKGLRHP